MFLTQHLYFLKPGDSTPGPSVNPLYSKCKILKFADNIKLSNFLFAHDSIKSNLPTTFCDYNKHPHTSEIKKQIRQIFIL